MGLKMDFLYFASVLGFFLLFLHDFLLIQWVGGFMIINESSIIIWSIEVVLIIFIIVMSIYKLELIIMRKYE